MKTACNDDFEELGLQRKMGRCYSEFKTSNCKTNKVLGIQCKTHDEYS